MDSALDPVLAVVLAGILVAGTSAAVQITRWLVTTAAAATRVRVSEVQAPEFDPSSSSWSTSTVEHGFRHLVSCEVRLEIRSSSTSRTNGFLRLVPNTENLLSSEECCSRTCQLKGFVQGHDPEKPRCEHLLNAVGL